VRLQLGRAPERSSLHERAHVQTPGAARSDLTNLAHGAVLSLLGGALNALFGFVLGVVVTRGLEASGAGVFFEAIALFTILATVAQLGANAGLVRMLPRYLALDRGADLRGCIRVALSPVVVAGSMLAGLLFGLAPQLADLLSRGIDSSSLSVSLRALAPFLPLAAATTVALAGTRALGSMVPYVAIESIGKAAIRPVLVVIVLAGGLGSLAVALAWALPILAGLVGAVLWLVVLLRRAEQGQAHSTRAATATRNLAADFWRFAAFRGVAAILQILILWLGILFVGALASSREAGIYGAASRYVTVGGFVLQAVLLVIGPQISGLLARGSLERAANVYQASTVWLTALSFPLYLSLAVFAPLALSIFGPEFESGTVALVILSLAMLVNMATGPVSVVLLMAGKSSWNLANNAAAVAVNIVLNVLLIPGFGITGAAVAWAASIVVQNLVPIVQIWRLLDLHPFSHGLLLVGVAATVFYGLFGVAMRASLGTSIATLSAFLAVATFAYAVFLWRFRRPLNLDVVREAVAQRRGSAGAPSGAMP
jgi:O-antigen/teichoic acid export membrane protein